MLTDNQKTEFLQVINDLSERVSNISFKLEDNQYIDNEEWNYYNEQFIKIHTRLARLEELVIDL